MDVQRFYVCERCDHYYHDVIVSECDCSADAVVFREVVMVAIPRMPTSIGARKVRALEADGYTVAGVTLFRSEDGARAGVDAFGHVFHQRPNV